MSPISRGNSRSSSLCFRSLAARRRTRVLPSPLLRGLTSFYVSVLSWPFCAAENAGAVPLPTNSPFEVLFYIVAAEIAHRVEHGQTLSFIAIEKLAGQRVVSAECYW
jgi:hypothetical protein